MRDINKSRRNNYVILILSLVIFTLAFYFVNYVYTINSKNTKTIVIEKSLFNSNQSINKDDEVHIENTSRTVVDYSIFNPSVLDDDSITFINSDKDNIEKICILNIKNNNLTEIYKRNGGGLNKLAISRDGNKIVYSATDMEKGTGKTYLYDIATKENKEISNSTCYAALITNDSKYIGVNDDYLFIKDLNNGKVDNLMSINDANSIIVKKPGQKLKAGRYTLKLSQDGNIVYFLSQTLKNNNGLYATVFQVNLSSREISQSSIKGDIYNFEPLDNGNFVYCGRNEESSGIFIYNVKNKSYKLLKQGNISNIEITLDNRKISYTDSNNDGSTELHTAVFNKDKIESDIIVYRSSTFQTNFHWENDGKKLFYFTLSNSGSTIYRFSFKN